MPPHPLPNETMAPPPEMSDSERLRRYDKLVQTLLMNCPLGTKPSPGRAERWKRAYNALFRVARLKWEVQRR